MSNSVGRAFELTVVLRMVSSDWPTNSVPTQAENQFYRLDHPNIYSSRSAGAHEGTLPADSKLLDLHDKEQHQNNQEELHWEPRISSVAETRDLDPDQRTFAMNTCK